MELVEKNILPVESSLKEAIIGEEAPATLCGHAGQMQKDGAQGFLLFDSCFDLGTEVQSVKAREAGCVSLGRCQRPHWSCQSN